MGRVALGHADRDTQVFGRRRTAVHDATQRPFAGSKSDGSAALICSTNFGGKLMKSLARSVAVLVVEDEALIRMMIAGMIEELVPTIGEE